MPIQKTGRFRCDSCGSRFTLSEEKTADVTCLHVAFCPYCGAPEEHVQFEQSEHEPDEQYAREFEETHFQPDKTLHEHI